MENKTAGNGSGSPPRPDPTLVRRELERVLSSASFQHSKRSHDFLAYVVERALEGDSEKLKERTLAVDVFQRDADSDLDHDSIVRVGAREVRKRLLNYYATESSESLLRIELPTGTYVPVFLEKEAAPPERVATQGNGAPLSPAPALEPVRKETSAPRKTNRRFLLIGVTAVLAVAAAVSWRTLFAPLDAFDLFWQPAFRQKTPVLIVQAHPIVYHPSRRATRLDEQLNGPAGTLQKAIHVPPELLNGSDFVPAVDQYVGVGDGVAAMRISEMLIHHSRTDMVRLATKLDFADLRETSAVLVGAYTNRWTVELAPGLRYRFAYCINESPCIVDSVSGRQWVLSGKSDNGRSGEDYVAVCRLPHAQTGGFVIIGAGLTQYGTEEAGRILANASALDPILGKLPQGWAGKNMQLVLHSQILGETSAPPELVAWSTW